MTSSIYVKARRFEASRASYWEMQVNDEEDARNWLQEILEGKG
jgi:hypothetical protein